MPSNPPPGYTLEEKLQNVPDFEKPLVPSTKIDLKPDDSQLAGEVVPWAPRTITIFGADQGDQSTVTHEMTHVYQDSRNLHVLANTLWNVLTRKVGKSYDYGGADGLLAAQQQRKTVKDFGPEQQADIVADYQQASTAAIKQGDAATLDKLNRAYGPIIRQIANLPSRGESMTTMTQKDLTPAAPGLPPAVESGILAPLKVMGGKERVMVPRGYTLEK